MNELTEDDKAAMESAICCVFVRLANSFDIDPANTVTDGPTTTDPRDSYKHKHFLNVNALTRKTLEII